MKAIWAVACAVPIFGVLFALGSGCSGTRSQVKEFHRMDVGEGPGEVLTHLINLQKESGDQRVAANPPSAVRGETLGRPPVPSDHPPDVSAAGISMSKGPGAMHDVMPAAPGNRSLPVHTEGESAATPEGIASHNPSTTVPIHNVPSPTVAAQEPPVSAPTHVSQAPAVPPSRPGTSAGKVPGPLPPVAHHMEFKREATLETASRENGSTTTSPPASGINTMKRKTAPFTGGSKYRIGPEDVLHIDVWGNVELTGDVTVRPDGKISMALIQDVQAEGLTAGELSDVIQNKLKVFIKNPEVAVIVTQINAPKVFVIGNVTKPGSFPLRGDMSVLQALSLAGGFTPFASPKNIKVVSVGNGGQETRRFNYYDMIGKEGEGKYFLKPGDTIVVP